MESASWNAFSGLQEAFPIHLAEWAELSGDLLGRGALLAAGPARQAIAEELLDRHVDEFLDCTEDVNAGAPARSAGGPCRRLEQVGNRGGGHEGAEALARGVRPADRGPVGAPGGMALDGSGQSPTDGAGAALLRDLARGWSAGGARGRATVFGRRAYTAASPEHCQAGAWSLGLTNRSTGEWQVWKFRCRSWRCARCAPAVNRRDAERIEEALGPVPLDQLLFVTLTFDRNRYRSSAEAWLAAGECWKRLRDSLAYHYAAGRGREKRKTGLVYVQTWEQHADGWPHIHALIWASAIAADVKRRGSYQRVQRGEPRPIWRWSSQVLRPRAIAAGFGPILDVQFPRAERGQLAGYLVKLAAELTGSAKKNQTPISAPKGFRRIRATPKFLEPARRSTGEYVGELLLAPFDQVLEELDAGAESFHAAAEIVKGRIERWQKPRSARSAESCSTRAGSPPTEALLTV